MATVNPAPLQQLPVERADRREEVGSHEADSQSVSVATAEAELAVRQNITNQTRLLSTLRELRKQLHQATSERQALSEHQITDVLSNVLDRQDQRFVTSSVRAAAGEELPARPDADREGGEHSSDASRGDAFGTDKSPTLARMARGDVRPGTPPPAMSPRVPVTPQTPMPQVPVPQPPTPQTPTAPVVATPTGTPGAPAPEGTPSLPGQPVVATETGLPATPEVPAPGVRTFNYGEAPRAGASNTPERQDYINTQGPQFAKLLRGGTPQPAAPMPTPRESGEGGMRLADLLRNPGSSSTDSERGEGTGEGRSGVDLKHSLAIGFKRQLRDSSC